VLTSGDYGAYAANGTTKAITTDWVFVYDITNPVPVQKQVIQVTNTYNGIVFDPSGTQFYVSGGRDSNVHIFGLSGGVWAEQAGSPVSLGISAQVANPGASNPVSLPGPAASGIAITNDGTKLVVTNYENDSISVLTKSGGTWSKTADLDLRPGKINPANSGVPGGAFPFWVSIVGNSKAFVSCMRDREIDVVDISGATPLLLARIALTGQPLKSTLNAAQDTLYVAEDQADLVAVINTSTNPLRKRRKSEPPMESSRLTGFRSPATTPTAWRLAPTKTHCT